MRRLAIIDTAQTSSVRPRHGFGAARIAVLLGCVTLVLPGCGKVPAITPEDTSPIDLASVPVWDAAYLGTLPGELVGKGGQVEGCTGFIDSRTEFPESGETRLEGWAWNTAKSAGYEAVILTGPEGQISGAGVTSVNRPDVKAALPQIVSDDLTGFVAFAQSLEPNLQIHGWDRADDTLCLISKTE